MNIADGAGQMKESSTLQCVAVCCSVLQCADGAGQMKESSTLQCVAVCCRVLQYVELLMGQDRLKRRELNPQKTATDCNRLQQTATDCNRLQQNATELFLI